MMNVALWQQARPFSDGHIHPDNDMSSWFDVLSHWVTHGWLSAIAIIYMKRQVPWEQPNKELNIAI
jgi:hypothetical protein